MTSSHASAETCVDCRDRQAEVQVRNRWLCKECFIRYVSSKILKRMESYGFRNLAGDEKRRLFLPLSGGISSLVLLQILHTQLQNQISKRNRTAYELVIARSIPSDVANVEEDKTAYMRLAETFPGHIFLPPLRLDDVFHSDDKIEDDLVQIGLERHEREDDVSFCQRIISSATSATTQADLKSILLRRLLVSVAKAHGCESILWGHSDSRLAAMTLAEVAKGRGGSVSSLIADGPSQFGINFNYPVRDLFKAELATYAALLPTPLIIMGDEITGTSQQNPSLRNTAIDTLLTNYINSQGEKYPSIMANVVRTAGKLQTVTTNQSTKSCPFCLETLSSADGTNGLLCYGCTRMKQDIKSRTI